MHTLPCAQNGTLLLFWNTISEQGACWWSLTFQHHCGPAVPESDLQTSPCPGFPQPPANCNSVHSSLFVVSKANSILSILCWKWHFLSLPMYLTPSSCCTSWYFCHLLPIPSCVMYVLVVWKCSYHCITCAALPSFLRVSEILVQGQ